MNIQKVKTEILKIASYNPRKDLKEKDPEYQKIKNSSRLNEIVLDLFGRKWVNTYCSRAN